MRRNRHPLALLVLLLIAGAAGCGDRELGPDTLARAGDLEFEVEEAAQLIAPVTEIPEDPEVFEALADFWTDYTLLALVVNEEGALDQLDLSILTRQQRNQELVLLLREEVIDVDTTVSDEELRAMYEAERPGERVRARHILLLYPEGADQAQRDSVRALAEELRDRARAGEDFAALAEEHSDDEGSAARGGDLNFFERGTMVPPFEEAAFDMEPGEVSDPVESEFGLHVIRVEEREFPTFEEIAEQFREEVRAQQETEAESIFVAGIEEPANVELEEGALDRAREIAGDVGRRLSGGEADQPLVSFEGGNYTAQQYRWFLLNQPPQVQDQIAEATDEQIESMLRNLARGELLVREAEERGLSLPEGRVEELEQELRDEYRAAAERVGLDDITSQEGESLRDAVEREIDELMPRLVSGEQDIFPLGELAMPLREAYDARFSQEATERASERTSELRSGGGAGDTASEGEEFDPGSEPPEDPPSGDEPDGGAS